MRPLAVLFLCVIVLIVETFGAEPQERPNVLFIAVDDLNHWVGYLGRNKQTLLRI